MQRSRMDEHWAAFFAHVDKFRASLTNGPRDEVDVRHEIANALQLATSLFELELRVMLAPLVGG